MSLVWIESFNLKLGEGNRLLRIWSVFYHVFKRIMSRYLTSEDIGIGILWKLRDGGSGLSCNMNSACTVYIYFDTPLGYSWMTVLSIKFKRIIHCELHIVSHGLFPTKSIAVSIV